MSYDIVLYIIIHYHALYILLCIIVYCYVSLYIVMGSWMILMKGYYYYDGENKPLPFFVWWSNSSVSSNRCGSIIILIVLLLIAVIAQRVYRVGVLSLVLCCFLSDGFLGMHLVEVCLQISFTLEAFVTFWALPVFLICVLGG